MKNILEFKDRKESGEKIIMATCYDYTAACLLESSPIDCVLVGDSAAMVMHGHSSTTAATMPMMHAHTSAVARGIKTKFIIGDLPFFSYRKSLQDTMDNVQQLIQAGAHAVKLEGAAGNLDMIQHIVESGVPVMGHIGLTPQAILTIGGHKVQGKADHQAHQLIQDAKALETAGCFSLVLECVPTELAKIITQTLKIPTIGIGAGPHTDGQVLVWHDLLGLQTAFKPKFLKHFTNGASHVSAALQCYADEVKAGTYPSKEHCYS